MAETESCLLSVIVDLERKKIPTKPGSCGSYLKSLATQEAEIKRIAVQSQPIQTVCGTLSRKTPSQKGMVEWL
jgi:hypothetical protein